MQPHPDTELVSRAAVARTTSATNDTALVDVWVRTVGAKSIHTQAAYRTDAAGFLAFLATTGDTLHSATMETLLDYAASLAHLAPKTQKRKLAAIKSLLSFGQKAGYLQFNVGTALKLSKGKNTLAERILSEEQVQRMLILESDRTKRALLRILYACGGRVSEVCGLRWRDVTARGDAGQVTLYGKGDKTRFVLLSVDTWKVLQALRRPDATPETPLFQTRTGQPLHRSYVFRVVQQAAQRAGLSGVSPHWMRHAHASHALRRGADIRLVQATLGHASIETTQEYLHVNPDDSSARYLPV